MAISQIVQNSLSDEISLGAKISSIAIANSTFVIKDDTAVNVGGGFIVITGQGFQSNCSVIVGSNSACSVTFVSSTEIRAQVPAAVAGSYPVYVVNGDGGTAIRVNALTYSSEPSWVTTSPLSSQSVDSSFSIQLSATGASTYVLQAGSTLPPGVTLAANGVLSGTVTGIENDTTYNFIVEAIDAENQESPISLAITITGQYQITRSLRFNSADSTSLSRTPGSAGNRKTWTWSGWVKRTSATEDVGSLFGARSGGSSPWTILAFSNGDGVGGTVTPCIQFSAVAGVSPGVYTPMVFRDLSAWYHIVCAVDTTQATDTNRVKIWVNNVQQTLIAGNFPSLNSDTQVNNTVAHWIGNPPNYSSDFNGYLAEIHFVDGTALTPSSFGEFKNNSGGVWVPKTVSGVTYGTNGFYLPFSDNSSTTTLGNDGTANNNDWTLNNFSVTAGAGNDSLVDSPTPYGTDDGSGADVRGSYATLNPLAKNASVTLSNGNLQHKTDNNTDWRSSFGTIGFSSGKYYWEMTTSADANSAFAFAGIAGTTLPQTTNNLQDAFSTLNTHGSLLFCDDGQYQLDGASRVAYSSSLTSGQVLGVAVDMDTKSLTFYKNGVSQNAISFSSSSMASRTVCPIFISIYSASTYTFNFGQRPFAYTAPSGYLTLNSQNITPAIAANSASTLANSYFDVVTYTGTGGAQSITSLNFAPDLVWFKSRSNSTNNTLYDTIRGASARLFSDSTGAEGAGGDGFSSFAANGFNLDDSGGGGNVNASGRTYVAWCWNAGGSTSNNTDGTISAQVRANPTAGFSVVSFTGNGTANATVGHGLGKVPKFIITKYTGGTANWDIYHSSLGIDATLTFTSDGTRDFDAYGTNAPTSSVFSTQTNFTNVSGGAMISYCWSEIEGFSKFGNYVGNGNTDGPFVYTGFRPRFVMFKRTDSGAGWLILDSARNTFNVMNNQLYANATDVESGGATADFLSNGVKIRETGGGTNANGGTYIFMAFAETPFKYARAR